MALDALRIDKWLWAARLYKSRSLAAEALVKGRVQVNGQDAKPARELRCGDTVSCRGPGGVRTVVVRALSDRRAAAPIACQLYEETAQSLRLRAEAAELRRLGAEPALTRTSGRPSRQDRRALEHAWDTRWGASHEG